jgi:protein required for attachment to host cells
MQMASIPHDALVCIADGTKAVFFRNRGTIQKPDLKVVAVLWQRNPPTRKQGTDRPGAVSTHVSGQGAAPSRKLTGIR